MGEMVGGIVGPGVGCNVEMAKRSSIAMSPLPPELLEVNRIKLYTTPLVEIIPVFCQGSALVVCCWPSFRHNSVKLIPPSFDPDTLKYIIWLPNM